MTTKKAKPAGDRRITVSNWKPVNSGCLRGFLTLTLPSCLAINNCQLLQAGERRWVGMPSRHFPTPNGRVHYQPIIEFASREAHADFNRAALDAIEHFLRAKGEW